MGTLSACGRKCLPDCQQIFKQRYWNPLLHVSQLILVVARHLFGWCCCPCANTPDFPFEQELAQIPLCHLLFWLQGQTHQLGLAGHCSFSAKVAWLPWSTEKPKPRLSLSAHTNITVTLSMSRLPKRNSHGKYIYQNYL